MERKEIVRQIRKASNINSASLLLFTVFMYGGMIAAEIVLYILFPESGDETNTFILTLFSFIQAALLFVLSLFVKGVAGKSIVSFGFNRPTIPEMKVVKYVVIVLSLSFLSSYASNFILEAIQSFGVEMNDIVPDTSTDFLFLLNIANTIFLAPVFEELLFRGAMTGNVARFGGFSMAAAVGICFGLWHENVFQLIYAAIIGVMLCWLTMKTGSIYPAIAVHFIFNGADAPMLLLYLFDTGYADAAYIFYILFVIVIIIAGLILLISTLVLDKKELSLKNENDEYSDITEGQKFAAYFTAPVTILVVLVNIFLIILNASGD
jgi:membrane protease YdiL (CAAX protease family)